MFRNETERQERLMNVRRNIRDLKRAQVYLEESIRICTTEYDTKDAHYEHLVTLPTLTAAALISEALLRLHTELENLTS